MATVYGRGSEWRRWDLHLHAPGTALADQFSGWDDFVNAVEAADPSIAVVGITDYASINAYKAFKEYHNAGRMQNIAFAFPNIEFRVSPETKAGKGINLHLLVCPDDPEHIDRIEEALGRLKIKRQDVDIPCSRAGLTRLGKLTNPKLNASPDAAYREGVNQFKIDLDGLRQWLLDEQWLSRNALVAVAAGSNDGASGLNDSGYLTTRREIYRFAHIIFSGNPAEREAWLGRGTIPEEEFDLVGVPKPVVHGSDAHSIAALFKPNHNRFCWIKADPTFEGLRQTLYEPEDRVHIGEAPPTTHEARTVLDNLTITTSNGWFQDDRQIPLNSGLAAIVGLKGSGKTALADMIAFAAGAKLDGENSFVARACDHITGLGVLVQWQGGAPDVAVIPDQPGGGSGLSVKYLSQKFVDQLCSGDSLTDELQREVESVIFQHLEPQDQMDCDDFAELRELRTQSIREARADIKTAITVDSDQIAELDEHRAAILKKGVRRLQLPQELAKLGRGMPKIDDKATASKIQELQKLRARQTKTSQQIAGAKVTLQQVRDVERRINAKIGEVATFWTGTEQTLSGMGLTPSDIAALKPTWTRQPAIFKARADAVEKQIKDLEGMNGATGGATDTLASLQAAIEKLETDLKLDATRKRQVVTIEKQRQQIIEEKRKLDADYDWATKEYKSERASVHERRMATYTSYFELLSEERAVLDELYAPLKTTLASQGAHEQKLDLVCRVVVDVDTWIAKGAELFDLRKTGSFRYNEIEDIAKSELAKAWASCNPSRIQIALEKCVTKIKESDVLKTQLKTGFQTRDVAEWLFSVDHIDITHGIQYEGKDLRLLSPGTKGIVLLILYLAVDLRDTRPLIIDQPDENLDNQSTYEILRAYFREAKKRRQIIIITHNPNLVVNTDAEQVIVAESALRGNGLPSIAYTFGSLEAMEGDGPLKGTIREAVCRIMEGGKDAFKMRESRYGQVLNS
jgi:predicted ATPase